MTNQSFNQLRKVADSATQAKVICTLVENYPQNFKDGEISAIASLLKELTNSVSVYLDQEISKHE